jgi:hypothetical protein
MEILHEENLLFVGSRREGGGGEGEGGEVTITTIRLSRG